MSEISGSTAIEAANQARGHCICLEGEGTTVCECPAPITREQVGRLHAYASQHPERAIVYSELADEWLTALAACLPEGDDPFEAWLGDPFNLPSEAELHHASDLETLLDMLGAPLVTESS